jgi:plasmid stabilization system protein ParE
MTESMTEAQSLLSERDAEIQSIQNRVEWTEEAKRDRINAIKQVYQKEYEEVKAKEQQKLLSDVETSKAAVYKLPMEAHASQAERAQVQAAFKRVWDDVEFETSGDEVNVPEKLASMLEYATTFGFELLEEAVYRKAVQIAEANNPNLHPAFQTDVSHIIESYHARHPEAARKYQKYADARARRDKASDVLSRLFQAQTSQSFRH